MVFLDTERFEKLKNAVEHMYALITGDFLIRNLPLIVDGSLVIKAEPVPGINKQAGEACP